MNSIEYLYLCDEVSVVEASLFVLGVDSIQKYSSVEHWNSEERPAGYDIVRRAIANALSKGEIKGNVIHLQESAYRQNPFPVDVKGSTVFIKSLLEWLKKKDRNNNPLANMLSSRQAYLDPNHERYAPKLAAAVNAWEAMEDASLYAGKSPKKALEAWLKAHAADFDLILQDGHPNRNGITEAAKVANWQPSSGAPKTPSR